MTDNFTKNVFKLNLRALNLVPNEECNKKEYCPEENHPPETAIYDSEKWNLHTKHKEQRKEQNLKDAEEGSGKYTFGCKPILTPGSYSSHTGKR